MNKCVYSNPELMKKVVSAVRFIDDGTGLFEGSKDEFKMWIADVNKALLSYGLIIEEYQIEDPGSYVSFLDIQFTFDTLGSLQTDLFIKKTDSRSYLHFTSSHPNHIFSGIVYSQCIRLRRIINSKERLQIQLSSLKKAFLAAGYPRKMVENISNKVLNSERSLERKQDISEETTPFLPIRVVSTFGSDEELVSTSKKYEERLTRTRSFSESDGRRLSSDLLNTYTYSEKDIPVCQEDRSKPQITSCQSETTRHGCAIWTNYQMQCVQMCMLCPCQRKS